MPKGNNYPATVGPADLHTAQAAATALETALAFVPNLGPDVLTSATITPERLGLADKAAQVAAAAPEVMRRSFQPQRLTDKLAYYRQLASLRATLAKADQKLANALNVLGSDMMFDIGNIHEDVEKDNGETVDLGPLRTELHDYYTHPAARKANKPTTKPAFLVVGRFVLVVATTDWMIATIVLTVATTVSMVATIQTAVATSGREAASRGFSLPYFFTLVCLA